MVCIPLQAYSQALAIEKMKLLAIKLVDDHKLVVVTSSALEGRCVRYAGPFVSLRILDNLIQYWTSPCGRRLMHHKPKEECELVSILQMRLHPINCMFKEDFLC